MALVMDGDEQTLGSPEHQTKLLTRQTHSRGVHNGHQLLRVLAQHLVEQLLVPLQEVRQEAVLVEGVLEPPEVPQSVIRSLVLGLDPRWEKAMDAETLALLD